MIDRKDHMVEHIGNGEFLAVNPERIMEHISTNGGDAAIFDDPLRFVEAAEAALEDLASTPEVLQDTATLLDDFDEEIARAETLHQEASAELSQGCPGSLTMKAGGYCVTICRSPLVADDGSCTVPTIVRRQT